jgi:hypothetical protein
MTREEKIDRLIHMELERMKHKDLLRIAEEQLFAELRDEDDEYIDYLYDRHNFQDLEKTP